MTNDKQAPRITLEEYEKIEPWAKIAIGETQASFYVPSKFTYWRVESLYKKEPWTIEWLNRIPAGSVLYDIGANVGMYSVYAALKGQVKVKAFEPESGNFFILNKNIYKNSLADLVQAYPIGVSNKTEFTVLNMQDLRLGGSCHAAGEPLDFHLKKMERVIHRQGCPIFSLDDLVYKNKLEMPNYIKLDVDGFEHLVFGGASKLLKENSLQSIIVELNTHLEEHKSIIALLKKTGFRLDEDLLDSSIRKSGAFEGVGEHVFIRN